MKKIIITTLILLSSFLTFFTTAHADTILDYHVKILEIDKILNTSELRPYQIKTYVRKLNDIADSAEDCVIKKSQSVVELDSFLDAMKGTTLTGDIATEINAVSTERTRLQQEIASCRFIAFRATELIKRNRDKLQSIAAQQVLTPTTTLFGLMTKKYLFNGFGVSYDLMYTLSGIATVTFQKVLLLLLALSAAAIFCRYFRFALEKYMQTFYFQEHSMMLLLVSVIRRWILQIISSLILVLFCYFTLNHVNERPGLLAMANGLFSVVISLAVSDYIISIAHLYYKQNDAAKERLDAILFHIKLFSALMFAGYCVSILLREQSLPTQIKELAYTLFFAVLTPIMTILFWHGFKLTAKAQSNTILNSILKSSFIVYLLVIYSSLTFGYLYLAVYLTQSILLTGILIVLSMSTLFGVHQFSKWLNDSKNNISRTLKGYLGIRLHRRIKELDIIEFTTLFLLLCFVPILFMEIWGVSENFTDLLIESFLNGFQIAGLTINAYKLTMALYIFSFLNLFSRFLSNLTTIDHQLQDDKQTQDAIASILKYIGFSISLLIALIASGVNFTGLAIVAGTLSVVIGLGLQDIVTNFVSGLILLIERPIKTGDRIIVGTTEGYVKKVRIRATQITTLAHEDIIIPNAEIIKNPITNYTFNNINWRVTCKVGVAYGSDIDLVTEVLLDVGKSHPEANTSIPNNPRVLFKTFGESSLNFELWCIIKNVNHKNQVESELNMMIDRAFRLNKITIAFPQRDLHIIESSVL